MIRRPPLPSVTFSPEEAAALREIVIDWINEGFIGGPPYGAEQYAIFERLGVPDGAVVYDIRRPT